MKVNTALHRSPANCQFNLFEKCSMEVKCRYTVICSEWVALWESVLEFNPTWDSNCSSSDDIIQLEVGRESENKYQYLQWIEIIIMAYAKFISGLTRCNTSWSINIDLQFFWETYCYSSCFYFGWNLRNIKYKKITSDDSWDVLCINHIFYPEMDAVHSHCNNLVLFSQYITLKTCLSVTDIFLCHSQ